MAEALGPLREARVAYRVVEGEVRRSAAAF